MRKLYILISVNQPPPGYNPHHRMRQGRKCDGVASYCYVITVYNGHCSNAMQSQALFSLFSLCGLCKNSLYTMHPQFIIAVFPCLSGVSTVIAFSLFFLVKSLDKYSHYVIIQYLNFIYLLFIVPMKYNATLQALKRFKLECLLLEIANNLQLF